MRNGSFGIATMLRADSTGKRFLLLLNVQTGPGFQPRILFKVKRGSFLGLKRHWREVAQSGAVPPLWVATTLLFTFYLNAQMKETDNQNIRSTTPLPHSAAQEPTKRRGSVRELSLGFHHTAPTWLCTRHYFCVQHVLLLSTQANI